MIGLPLQRQVFLPLKRHIGEPSLVGVLFGEEPYICIFVYMCLIAYVYKVKVFSQGLLVASYLYVLSYFICNIAHSAQLPKELKNNLLLNTAWYLGLKDLNAYLYLFYFYVSFYISYISSFIIIQTFLWLQRKCLSSSIGSLFFFFSFSISLPFRTLSWIPILFLHFVIFKIFISNQNCK